jgi:Xaa-Pro aminopeptidase
MKKILAFAFLLAFCAAALPVNLNAEAADAKPTFKTILVTPPAPKFSDAERQSELARRRKAVADKMSENSMLVLFSADPKLYTNSVNYVYRQENNLYYLTNLKQNNATFVLIKSGGNVQEILFLPKRNPQSETWDGKMYSNEAASKISGLKTIVEASDAAKFVQALKDKTAFTAANGNFSISAFPETVYLLKGNKREFGKENTLAEALTGYKVENALPIFAELRLVKSPYEIKLMQHAIDITTEAQMRSMAMVGRAKWEYEVQAEVEYTFRRRNADFWGYPSIVGCGPNATTLHYQEAQGEVKPGELLLMDVGAEYDHYTADVTRTFPVNGKFSKEQAEIYQIVYDAQEAAARHTKPGVLFGAVEDEADEVIKKGLTKLGLITAPDAVYQITSQGKQIDMPQFKFWFMHGLGHWLGMNVHDVGAYSTPLKPGMIFTNEPGIYIREDALDYLPDTPANKEFIAKVRPAFEKYKNIGVRIEDDLLVTATGAEWMTKKLPRKISEIEAFMAKASKELPYTAFNSETPFENFLLSNQTISNAEILFNNFNFSGYASGQTVRRGWISSGKQTAYSGLTHADHSHAE